MLKLYFYTQFVVPPDMFQSVLIIFGESLYISKAYIETQMDY
jgi:hypothetical protein